MTLSGVAREKSAAQEAVIAEGARYRAFVPKLVPGMIGTKVVNTRCD